MIQTQTIDMTHVKKVLENCPNFDKIVHYDYPFGDILSQKLIYWYRDLIFSANGNDANQLMLISALDKSLYLYIKDNKYKRGLRKILSADELSLTDRELIKNVVKKLITFTSSYENKIIREVNVSKWL